MGFILFNARILEWFTIQDVIREKKSKSFFHTLNGAEALHYLVPIRLVTRGPAVLEIVYRTSQIEGEYRRRRNEIVVAGLVILGALTIAVWYLTKWHISQPVQALIEGTAAIGAGELARKIQIGRASCR